MKVAFRGKQTLYGCAVQPLMFMPSHELLVFMGWGGMM
jgi:hypothetical protein